MSDPTQSFAYQGHKIDIFPDYDPQNPREDDNLCEIHYHSNRYVLGNKNWSGKIEEYSHMLKEAERQGDLIIPLYAYIHGGIVLSLGTDFRGKLAQGHYEFDSGRCGTVIVRKKKFISEFGVKIFTQKLKYKAFEIAHGEIETFNQYLSGDIYGYVINDGEESCWGYYGIEDCISEAKSVVDWMNKQQLQKKMNKLKDVIRNRVPLGLRSGILANI